jgi:hypothetical protein
MRVVFFLWDFGRGGAERVAFNLSNYLCEKGNEVHILTINSKDELSGRLDKNYANYLPDGNSCRSSQ